MSRKFADAVVAWVIAAFTGGALLAASLAASAAIVDGDFAGEIYSGTDTRGLFGAQGASLVGQPIHGTFRIDTSQLLVYEGCAPNLLYNCASGSYAVEITNVVNGQALTMSGVYGYVKVVDRFPNPIGPGEPAYDQLFLQTNGTDYVGNLSILSLTIDFIHGLGFDVQVEPLTPNFDPGWNVPGQVLLFGTGPEMAYSFRIDNVSANVSAALVPEPNTFALMLLGMAALGHAVRRRLI